MAYSIYTHMYHISSIFDQLMISRNAYVLFYKCNPSVIIISIKNNDFIIKEMFSSLIIKSQVSLPSYIHFLPPQLTLCNEIGTSRQ